MRLFLATAFLLCAYSLGICFVIGLIQQTGKERGEGRFDEVSTILVLLFFNIWHVSRNVRGWTQFVAIKKTAAVFIAVQRKFAETYPREDFEDPGYEQLKTATALLEPCVQGLLRLQISNRLIDNDVQTTTPFLNPFYRPRPPLNPSFLSPQEDAWAIAAWRAWWTQDITMVSGTHDIDLTAPASYKCDLANRYRNVENLLNSEPSGLASGQEVIDQRTDTPITTKLQWAEALLHYGGKEGQQDTHGEDLPPIATATNASGIALLVKEKTRVLPHRMSALWYATARFEEVYESRAFDAKMRSDFPHVIFPKWGGWVKIARGIAEDGIAQLSLTDRTITLLAGEMASASLILIRYPERYRRLVDQIHADGLNARWTFGWSGLLACFSHLWTKERVYIAMLNGLSLLALTLWSENGDLDPNVRSMLYGYAAFAVSDRAVGRVIAKDRKTELDKRYQNDKGKTCRGSGLCATRIACELLGLPAEASHMDGLPAFCTGWASEFLERKPGNQDPEHGWTHNDVEAGRGSSNVFRYPYSHS